MKIFGIDDNADITKLLDTVLNSMGHEYTFVNNGRDGVKSIRTNSYDMVLLDLSMPDFSGLDVIADLQSDGQITKQKIVLFTASSVSDREIQDMLSKGVHSCIRKPVDIDILLDKLSEIENPN